MGDVSLPKQEYDAKIDNYARLVATDVSSEVLV